MRKALGALADEAMAIIEESKKDDEVDADGDGVADTKQISGRELAKRKLKLVLTKMDPEKVNNAIASIYKGAILAVCCICIRSNTSARVLIEIPISPSMKQSG